MEQIGAFLPLILIFGVFYILLIRPQQRKLKQHREMINNLRRGDKIITSGGIIGTINKVNDNKEILLQISENVEIKIQFHGHKFKVENLDVQVVNRGVLIVKAKDDEEKFERKFKDKIIGKAEISGRWG